MVLNGGRRQEAKGQRQRVQYMITNITRRKFVKTTAKASALAVAGISSAESILAETGKPKQKICIYSKHLQWLDYDMMAKTAAEIGFDGIDLTVRPKGHVLPENAAIDLPRAFEAVKKAGIEVIMITTAIKNTSEPYTESILKTAGQLGIPYYRMGWYKYDRSISIVQNHSRFKENLKKLAEINDKYGIKGAYQNHSGDSFGAAIWDLGMILNEVNSPWVGCQYDIRHATVEGAKSWPAGLRYIAPHINTLDIKDFTWINNINNEMKLTNVPLGQGLVDFKRYFNMLDELSVKAPMSIHFEYDLGGAEHGEREISKSQVEIISSITRDLDYLRSVLHNR